MIYSFFDAGHPMREGLGTYIIADHIQRAAGAGLPYVYLGYWIEGSARMAYKARFRPLEKLGPDGWSRFEPTQSERLAAMFELAYPASLSGQLRTSRSSRKGRQSVG